MVKGEVIEVDIKSPVPAGFKSPAQIRLETRAQEPFSPKSFADIQAQLENADRIAAEPAKGVLIGNVTVFHDGF
ncbi:hypothetical protein T484DRAFT_1883762 [Baffinella frigidus]|nr:hypothetical protein T484DRAFT_1883762 [Cryptophyta sp. CCMP2293]